MCNTEVEISVGCRRKPTGFHKKPTSQESKLKKKADRFLHKVVKYLLMNSTVPVFAILWLQFDTLMSLKLDHLLTLSLILSLKNWRCLILLPIKMETAGREFIKSIAFYLFDEDIQTKLLRVNFTAILIDGTTDLERPLSKSIKTIQPTKFLLYTLKWPRQLAVPVLVMNKSFQSFHMKTTNKCNHCTVKIVVNKETQQWFYDH